VDAVQFLTGCTFGKGNLIHKDYGKNAFSFFRRKDGKALRIVTRTSAFGDTRKRLAELQEKSRSGGLNEAEEKEMQAFREKLSEHIMEADLADLFEIKQPKEPVPQKARIMDSLICESCGEPTMEARIRRSGENALCIPCFEALENG
ncbi:FmdE family protein, partial [Thermodesulfobacteriota bacterium]